MSLAEQQIQLHDCTETSCAVRIGELLNVRWIVMGSYSKKANLYILNADLVDLQTGRTQGCSG
jgi:TolB-like protein